MLEGRLGDFTLPDILRLLAFTAKSGRLWVHDGGVVAHIDVDEGRVRDGSADVARLDLARRLLGRELVDVDTLEQALEGRTGLPSNRELAHRIVELGAVDEGLLADVVREQLVDSLFELLRWSDGAFRFEARALGDTRTSVVELALDVDQVLEEAQARLSEHAELEKRTGDRDAVVTIHRPARDEADVSLPPEGWTLLGLVDGHRTVGDLIELTGQGEHATRRTLAALCDAGVIAVGDPSEIPPAERLVAAHEALSAHERRLAPPDESLPDEVASPSAGATAARGAAAAARDGTPGDGDAPRPVTEPTSEPAEPAEPAAATVPRPAAPTAPLSPTSEADEPTPWESEPVDEPVPAAATVDDEASSGVTPLRAKAGQARLRTDPKVDEDLVRRLIDGVESL